MTTILYNKSRRIIDLENHYFAILNIISDFKQASSMDAKTTEWMVDDEKNIHTDLKYLHRVHVNYKSETVFIMEKYCEYQVINLAKTKMISICLLI